MGPIETVRCMSSYAWARIRPVKNPQNLEDWVRNQFGYRLFSIFFKTYTEKVWGISTKELSADWAAQRIKGLDLGQAIKSALVPQRKKSRDAVIKTLIDRFRYPRFGPGQMWERTRQLLTERGNTVALGQEVVSVRQTPGVGVTSVVVRDTATGATREVGGTHFISTLPIRELVNSCEPPLPEPVRAAANQLKYRDFLTVAVVINRENVFPDNWIYIHDPSVQVGRMQNFKAWSPEMVADPATTCLGLEYFCFEGDGLWASSDDALVELARRELAQLGMCKPEEVVWGVVVRQPKAYPVYDDVYKHHLAVIAEYVRDGPAQPATGRPQRYAPLQQPGPLDDDGAAGGAQYCAGRPLRSLEGEHGRRVPRGSASGGRGSLGPAHAFPRRHPHARRKVGRQIVHANGEHRLGDAPRGIGRRGIV